MKPMEAARQNGSKTKAPGAPLAASIAGLMSAILASSCCLPLFPFAFAAGAAGTSAFFVTLRPFLQGASVLLIAFGFYRARRAARCNRRPGALSWIILWSSAAIVIAFIMFPQAIANLIADLLSKGH